MKLLVVGDLIIDYYNFCKATRLCPEAPVPVLVSERQRESQGGAGLVYAQLGTLQDDVRFWYGSQSLKERIFAGQHLIVRLDDDRIVHYGPSLKDETIAWADAIVVCDYDKGAMTVEMAQKVMASGKTIFVDSKKNWDWYWSHRLKQQVFCFPNEHEKCEDGLDRTVIQKLGAKGCKLGIMSLPATVEHPVDVSGAGDIFMAAFVHAWTLQLPEEDCLVFANILAGESCRHLGTYVVPREFAQEVLDSLKVCSELRSQAKHPAPSPTSVPPEAPHQQDLTKGALVAYGGYGNLPPDSIEVSAGNPVDPQTHVPSQGRPVSPSAPRESTDARPHEDQLLGYEPDGTAPWEG